MRESQGNTVDRKIRSRSCEKELDYGASRVTLGRFRRFESIALINGTTKNRLCRVIKKHTKMKRRIAEGKRSDALCEKIVYNFIQKNRHMFYLIIHNFFHRCVCIATSSRNNLLLRMYSLSLP